MDDFIAKPTLKRYIYLDNIRVAGKDGKEHENPFNHSKAIFQNGQEFNKKKKQSSKISSVSSIDVVGYSTILLKPNAKRLYSLKKFPCSS